VAEGSAMTSTVAEGRTGNLFATAAGSASDHWRPARETTARPGPGAHDDPAIDPDQLWLESIRDSIQAWNSSPEKSTLPR
jgi:hypothetical protein